MEPGEDWLTGLGEGRLEAAGLPPLCLWRGEDWVALDSRKASTETQPLGPVGGASNRGFWLGRVVR